MPILFNTLLVDAGFDLENVRLLRHKDQNAAKGRSPYELWRDNRPQFDAYQSSQGLVHASKLVAPYWASFLGTPSDDTLFVGIYHATNCRLLDVDQPQPHRDGIDKAGSCNIYDLTLDLRLSDLIGRLVIDWGPGMRTWIQRSDLQDKTVLELRTKFQEPAFPGFLNFMEPLSKIDALPKSWTAILQSARGVYLLTCPKTKEQYVGSATGEEAFWRRWQDYIATGHGGNVALKSRDPSDYRVSILEVAGSSATTEDILRMEQRWKAKLQSQEMGLNRN
ncbi:MAG: GIY-YIG nuclease family protein [Planctomycetota bacterium]